MNTITIVWIALPFLLGFTAYLLPKYDRYFALGTALLSLIYGLQRLFSTDPITLQLLDRFGVTLTVDSLSAYFIVTNGLVTSAVVFYCWQKNKSAFFYTQGIILHGSVNAVFCCADFISLYVALEVISIATFLLITYPRTDRSLWIGLRYLFISNTAMLLYLIGAVLVYQTHHSFTFAGLQGAPTEAIALILLGLFTKGGTFASGLWLPLTHSEAETPVSALLSGIVVKTGIFPVLRCAQLVEELTPILEMLSVATAFLGVSFAIFETDIKRILALSTVSQLGYVLGAPATGGFYALTHGLAKSSLFLVAGNLPSRHLPVLRQTKLPFSLWLVMAIAGLSIAGFPLLAGFAAKGLTFSQMQPWQGMVLQVAAVGTVIVFAKLLFLPFTRQNSSEQVPLEPGFWFGTILLSLGLIGGNFLHPEIYKLEKMGQSLLFLAIGWGIYALFARYFTWKIPRTMEKLEHLIGGMTLVITLLFGILWL